MSYDRIIISSGHGKKIRGAAGSPVPPYLDEVDEARKVVDALADELRYLGIETLTFHDDVSTTQNENLNRIVDYHNDQVRDLDISVHFNAYQTTSKPMGTEVLYLTQAELAGQVSAAIAAAGHFINRGPKKRTDLFFLNSTSAPAILLEVCFVDSSADADLYRKHFSEIARAIALELAGDKVIAPPPGEAVTPPAPDEIIYSGKCSWFGGPEDTGVSPSEGLAFIYDIDDAPHLFLPTQPSGTTGLARRLNPYVHYLAMRWDYDVHSKQDLLDLVALVRNPRTGFELFAFPADWGPHGDTDRICDLSPGLMTDLELETDDIVEIVFPYKEEGVTS
jgi:N-acetylmuramoyl-L-alanine amidase